MIMECKSGLTCECAGLDRVAPKSERRLSPVKAVENHNEVFDDWYKVVEEYSRLRLTQQSDRLVALMGVGTVFQSVLKCGYMAGLWENDIARGLLWDFTRLDNVSYRLKYRLKNPFAPTWSWASLLMEDDSAISFKAAQDDSFRVDGRFEYLGTSLMPGVADPNDQTVGELRVRASVLSATFFHRRNTEGNGKNAKLIFEVETADEMVLTSVNFHLDTSYPGDGVDFATAIPEDGIEVYCIVIGSMGETSDTCSESELNIEYFNALIVSSSSCKDNTHQRLGILDVPQAAGICSSTPKFFVLT